MEISTTVCNSDFVTNRKTKENFDDDDTGLIGEKPLLEETTEDEKNDDDDDEEELDVEWDTFLQNRYPVFITVLFFVQYWSYVMVTELNLLPDFADLLVFNPEKWYQPWRYFTVVFVHRNLNHLIGNMMKQLQFGILVEIKHGWQRTCLVYFVGAACGTLFHHICFSQAGVSSGASSATKALLFANIPPLVVNWRHHFKYHGNLLSTLLRIISNLGLVVYSACGFLLELIFLCKTYHNFYYQQHMETEEDTPPRQYISHAAHLGGCIGGLVIGALFLSPQSSSTSSPSDDENVPEFDSISKEKNDRGKVATEVSADLEQNVIPLITLLSALLATFG